MPPLKAFVVICPFCGRLHERHNPFRDVKCACGSDYNALRKFWLNRETGERRENKRK